MTASSLRTEAAARLRGAPLSATRMTRNDEEHMAAQ
jgi:hypothetical protein